MRFSLVRKLNLQVLNPYLAGETEDIGVQDADSFDEAVKMVDRLVAERIGYHRASAAGFNQKVAPSPTQVGPGHITPQTPLPVAAPVAIGTAPTPTTAVAPGVSNQPPADLA